MNRKKKKVSKKPSRSKPGKAGSQRQASERRTARTSKRDVSPQEGSARKRSGPGTREKPTYDERVDTGKGGDRRVPAKERPSFSLPEDVFFLTGRHTCEAVLRYQPKRVRHLYILDGGKELEFAS